jgi:hypothetical protein
MLKLQQKAPISAFEAEPDEKHAGSYTQFLPGASLVAALPGSLSASREAATSP